MVETIKQAEIGRYADFDNRERIERLKKTAGQPRQLPVIDFAAYTDGAGIAARRRVAAEIRDACTHTGFFYLANHGISRAEIDLAHDWGHLFFEMPVEEKTKVAKSGHATRQGWMPVGGLDPSANPDKDADQKETLVIPRSALPGEKPGDDPTVGRFNLPDEARMPGFHAFIDSHIKRRILVAQRLCRALALSLDLPEDYFDDSHRYLACQLTYNYYPSLDPETVGRTQWGISPHTDYGSFTLLTQDGLGGLEVRDPQGGWIDVPPVPGAFVVNIADLMSRWTNGVYISSLHRASNFNVSGRARISLPLFIIPNPRTMVRCIETCQGPGNPAKYEPVEAGPYVRTLIEQSHVIGRPGVAQSTVEGRFADRVE